MHGDLHALPSNGSANVTRGTYSGGLCGPPESLDFVLVVLPCAPQYSQSILPSGWKTRQNPLSLKGEITVWNILPCIV